MYFIKADKVCMSKLMAISIRNAALHAKVMQKDIIRQDITSYDQRHHTSDSLRRKIS